MKRTLTWVIEAEGDEEYLDILQLEMDSRFSIIQSTSERNARIKYRQRKNPYSKANVKKLYETLKDDPDDKKDD